MRKIYYGLLIIVYGLILAGCTKNINSDKMIDPTINSKSYSLETARTGAERAKGLSERESLADNSGMIFYFEKLDYLSFWMKDTLIPLQIIFVNGCEIVDIQEMAVESDPTNPQKTYKSKMIADKAIELNANSVQEYIGQKINNLCK